MIDRPPEVKKKPSLKIPEHETFRSTYHNFSISPFRNTRVESLDDKILITGNTLN